MKRNILTAAVRGTACILSLLLCGSYPAAAGNPADGSGTPAQTEITVNDGEMGTGLFQFEFSAGWVHEGGYPARFVGGDEHWSTTATSGAALPSLTFRFFGKLHYIVGDFISISQEAFKHFIVHFLLLY